MIMLKRELAGNGLYVMVAERLLYYTDEEGDSPQITCTQLEPALISLENNEVFRLLVCPASEVMDDII